MQVAAALAVALLALAALLFVASLTPFLAIPIAVFLFLVPVLWFGAAGRILGRQRHVDKSGVPTTSEATYRPAVDPAERP